MPKTVKTEVAARTDLPKLIDELGLKVGVELGVCEGKFSDYLLEHSGLEKLYSTYTNRGFVVLGFPANDFLGQEPGTDAEIKSFCTLTYGVAFPMFAKISVKGKDIHPLYAFLTSKETNPNFGGAISWNFNKFLIGRDGAILGRFGSRTKPEDKDLVGAIECALKSTP